jgi:ankyrin repeat protein
MMKSESLLFEAIEKGDLDQVNRLLEQNASLASARNEKGLSAVLVGMYYGQPAITHRLVEAGASLDIFEASAAGETGRARLLLDEQPGLANAWAQDGFQPQGLAAFFGRVEMARLLLDRGAQVNSASRNCLSVSPLNSAAAGGHLEIARLLIEHGADVNARQEGDFVPLHSAAQNGQVEMIKLLLEHGADASAKSKDGRTAYDFAMEKGHAEAARLVQI